MKIKPVIFSVIVSLCILFIFLIVTVWILVCVSPEKLDQALNITESSYGPVATLGAAVIAAYLFNDWKSVQKYTNEVKVSESLSAAIDGYVQSFNEYVDVMWRSRFDPDKFLMDQIFHNERLKCEKKKLNEAIYTCRVSFEFINFNLLEDHLDQIDKRLKNIHPFDLNKNDAGSIDSKYIIENENLCILSQKLYSLYVKEIRNPIFDYLLKNALK